MKENDWIVANINNPTFNNQDFKDVFDMSVENTQILPYSQYVNSTFVTQNDLFKDNNGNFSEAKFKDFYKDNLTKFQSFSESNPATDNFEYSLFDTSRRKNSRVKDPNFKFTTVANPDRNTIGIAGINQVERNTLSQSELAQQSKVWDSKNQKWLDYSPNDRALVNSPIGWIKNLFDEPLVLATWDSDGIDPKTGEEHQKGQAKINEFGDYYYETLGDRSLVGKEVLSSFDTLTVDGEGLNKYDCFDADGLDKSPAGVIAQTALAVLPMFWGPSAAIYSGALIAREMGKSLPMLYGMVSSIWGNEKDSQTLNAIAAFGDKLTTGTSQYSKEHVFTLENIGSLVADVANQWGQQKLIANSISKLRGGTSELELAYQKATASYANQSQAMLQSGVPNAMSYIGNTKKWAESPIGKAAIQKFVMPVQDALQKKARLGADASLVYMAIISNTDVYQSMLEHGANKRDAALVAFGSTLGMFSVDKYLGLGEVFFDELQNDTRIALRNAIKKDANSVAKSMFQEGAISNPISNKSSNAVKKLIQKGIDLGKNSTSEFIQNLKDHSLGFVGKAIGEGTEEVAEELVTDLSKQLYEWAGELSPNIFNTSRLTDVGAWENMGARYGMSFFGGALGGGLFYGVDAFKNGHFMRDTTKDELIYLVANKKTKDVLSELEKWRDSGKFGSTNLSASKYEYDKDGNPVYLSTEDKADSQNEYVYNRLREGVLQLDNILNTTKTNLSESELFDQMVLSEKRFLDLKEFLQDQSYVTRYQEQFREITRKLIDAETDLSKANRTADGTPNGELLPDSPGTQVLNDPNRLHNIEEAQKKLDDLRKQRDSFLKGEQSLPYTEKMLFFIDKNLNAPFMSATYDTWLQNNKHKTIDQLSEAEKETYKKEYLAYKRSGQSLDLDQAFDIYKQMGEKINPILDELSKNVDKVKQSQEAFSHLDDAIEEVMQPLSPDIKLEDESDEDFEFRNVKKEDETDEQFIKRHDDRIEKIQKLQDEKSEEFAKTISKMIDDAGEYIDPTTQRYIHRLLVTRRSDIANWLISNYIDQNISDSNIKQIFAKLKSDFSNAEEVKQNLEDYLNNMYLVAPIEPIREGLEEMFSDFGYDHPLTNLTDVYNFAKELVQRVKNKDPKIQEILNKEGNEGLKDNVESQLEAIKGMSDEDAIDSILTFDPSEDYILTYYLDPEYEDFHNYVNSSNYLANKEDFPNYFKNIFDKDQDLGANLQQLTAIDDTIRQDTLIKMFDKLQDKVSKNSPVIALLNKVRVALDPENKSIEEILQQIHQKFLGEKNREDFKIEDEEIVLNEATLILKSLKAYLYAAGFDANYILPVGHNRAINEYAEKHKDIFKNYNQLPTLDQNTTEIYAFEIQKYLNELDGDNPFSWISLSDNNKINKRQKLITADERFTMAKIDFFRVLFNLPKFTINGKEYDLLEGKDKIPGDKPAVLVHKLENLFFINLHKILNDGISFKEILEKSQILETQLVDVSFKALSNQVTSELNETIDYSKFTDFDKFTYLLTIAGISSNEYNNFIKQTVEESQKEEDVSKKKAPLTIQEHASRIAMATIKSPEIISQAWDYVSERLGETSSIVKPVLDRFVFIDGSAGVGKTQVIARNAIKFIGSKNIWLSAPKDTQIQTLKTIAPDGTSYTRKDLMEQIIGVEDYKKIMSDLDSNSKKSDYYTYNNIPGYSTTLEILVPSKIKINKVKDAPKAVIIDEITHFSGIELQILNLWAKENNIKIIALGDTNQNGYTKICRNIDREKIMVLRSPKLSISLRDVNVQKSENLLTTQKIINEMSKLEEDDSNYQQKFDNLKAQIQFLDFRVYNQDELNGDLITSSISKSDITKLKGDIAFVGDTNGTAYQQLVENYDSKKIHVLKPDEIQGQEFDYIIVDQKWALSDNASDVAVFNFLTNLYTLMSRGKSGSIFIDNGLSQIIGANKENLQKKLAPNLKDAIEPFIKAKLEVLNSLELIPNEEFEKLYGGETVVQPTTEEKSEEENQPKEEKQEGKPNTEEKTPKEETPTTETPSQEPSEGQSESTEEQPETPIIATTEGTAVSPTSAPASPTSTSETSVSQVEDDSVKPVTDTIIIDDVPPVITDEEQSKLREDMHDILEDKDLEELDIKVDNLISLESSPIRIYGSAHLAGLNRVVTKDAQGKEIVSYVNPRKAIKSDLQIFTDKDTITSGAELNGLVTTLLGLKSVILYSKSLDDLPSSVASVVNAKHLEQIKYKIEIRPRKDSDSFVGFTGLKTDGPGNNKIEINGLVYTLVGEFKNNKEETCKITLGLLANPDSFYVSDQVKESDKPAVKAKIRQYRALFDAMTQQYKDNGNVFYKDVTPIFSSLTSIRKFTGVGEYKKPVPTVNLETFRKTHPYTVISDPYIYIGSNFNGVNSDAIRGKAVVFVSNDTTLNPNDLMQIYLDQKTAINANSPLESGNSVRLLPLDNAGIPFSTLIQQNYHSVYNTTQKLPDGTQIIKIFPFEEDYMGARMLAALWNYRANLYSFINAVDSFCKQNNLEYKDLVRIAKYADAKWYKENNAEEVDEEVDKILSETTATQEELKLLSDFNDSLASRVRQFRVGGSRLGSGTYLRELTNISADNGFYKGLNKTPVGIYITPFTAQKQYKMLDYLISTVLKDTVKLKTNDGKEWPKDRQITTKEGFRNSISGLTSSLITGSALSFTEDGVNYEIQFPKKEALKHIPNVLQYIYKNLYRYQYNEDYNIAPIVLKDANDKTKDIKFYYGEFVNSKSDIYIPRDLGEDFHDNSFYDLISLAFHGTTANPTRTNWHATDAYFPNGIYIDPMGAEVVGEINNQAMFRKCITNEKLLTVNADIDMPIFVVTLNELQKAVESTQVEETEEPPIEPTETHSQETLDLIAESQQLGISDDQINKIKKKAENDDAIQEALIPLINKELSKNSERLFSQQLVTGNEIYHMSKGESGITRVTILEQISEKANLKEPIKSINPEDISWEDSTLILTLPNGTILKVIRGNKNGLKVEKIVNKAISTEIEEAAEKAKNNSEVSEEELIKIQQAKLEYLKSYITEWINSNQELIDTFKMDPSLIEFVDFLEGGYNSYGNESKTSKDYSDSINKLISFVEEQVMLAGEDAVDELYAGLTSKTNC